MNSEIQRRSLGLTLFLATLLAARGASDYATPYLFSTLAGTSSIGSQDGTGAAARFYSPRAMAADAGGNFYVVDNGNNTIRKVTPAGVVTTFAGTPGPAGSTDGTGNAARFDDPRDIIADSADNLYVVDAGNQTIRKITPSGVVTTLAGLAGVSGHTDGAGGAARFNDPRRIAIDAAGNLYVTETGNGAIRKITPTGTVSTFARAVFLELAGQSLLSYGAIAVDAAGAVYVSRHLYSDTLTHAPVWADNYTYHGGAVTKFSPDGTSTDLWTTVVTVYFDGRITSSAVSALALDPAGQLVAAAGFRIVRYSPSASTLTTVAGDGTIGSADGAAAMAKFGFPLALAYDRTGTLHVADTGNNNLRRLNATGTVNTLAGLALERAAGVTDGTGSAARLYVPVGTAVDSAGNVYVSDEAGHCIRKITPAGVVTTLAGAPGQSGAADGTGPAARFSAPTGVAVDAAGNIFVADTGNHTVRRITPLGETTTVAGTAGAHGWDDGRGAAAQFWFPYGVTVDPAGNVLVTSAGTVRKITPAGDVTTLAGYQSAVGYVDATGSNARFAVPYAIVADVGGNVFVSEAPDGPAIARIRKITPGGTVTTVAGAAHGYADGSATDARFHNPYGLALDPAGNLFAADAFNQVIRRITPQGTVTTLAGLADAPGAADGTGRDARFYYPHGIAVDAGGALYVTSGTTIRKGVLATLPTIATQPAGLSAMAGSSASFSVTAGGTPVPSFQWQRNGSAIAGATSSSFSLASVQTSDAGDYTVVVSNPLGSVTSTKAALAVTAAPVLPPPTPVGNGGGGGGGAPSGWFLGALALLAGGRKLAGCIRSGG